MKLKEFQVNQLRPGAESHGGSIACGNIGVGRVAINLACSACADQQCLAPGFLDSAAALRDEFHSSAGIPVNGEIEGKRVVEHGNPGAPLESLQKRADDFLSRGISPGVNHSIAAVRRFPGEGEFRPLTVELCTPVYQLL